LPCCCPGLRSKFRRQRNRRHRKREARPCSRQKSANIPCSHHRIGVVDEAIFVQDDLWITVSEYSREKILSMLGQIWYAPTCRFTLRKYQHVHIHLVPFFSRLAVLTLNTVTHSLKVVANPISFAKIGRASCSEGGFDSGRGIY